MIVLLPLMAALIKKEIILNKKYLTIIFYEDINF